MGNEDNYIDLVKRARLGEQECLNRLAGLAAERLRPYIRRLTLDDDMTEDILQETMLEMCKFLGKLENAERFWPWLFRIATRNFTDHHKSRQRRARISQADAARRLLKNGGREGLDSLISDELKEAVSASMMKLKPQYRTVLALRCYEEMPYCEISEVVGCSEFGARMRFLRAKRELVRQLSRRGLGKKSLLMALILFGKMTAASEASAAGVSLTAGTLKAGAAASLAAAVTGKTAVVMVAAGVTAAGAMAVSAGREKSAPGPHAAAAGSFFTARADTGQSRSGEQCWYYYPPNSDGAVMMWLKSGADGRASYCQWLQNDQANYYRTGRTIHVNNHRMWNEDLSVRRLPTDGPELMEFLSKVEGRAGEMEYVAPRTDGLLVVAGRDEKGDFSQLAHPYDVSDEEYFRYNRPAGARIHDNRDAMHVRGWTYFRIRGTIGPNQVSGVGRVPFVYARSRLNYAWLKLRIGNTLEVVDNGRQARVYDGGGRLLARYPGGAFFKGLGRPWMGLHAIDTVRRDAAEERIWFRTELPDGGEKARVTLIRGDVTLVYTIAMKADVVERIELFQDARILGELEFLYQQQIEESAGRFAAPAQQASTRGSPMSGLWLVRLAEGDLSKGN